MKVNKKMKFFIILIWISMYSVRIKGLLNSGYNYLLEFLNEK